MRSMTLPPRAGTGAGLGAEPHAGVEAAGLGAVGAGLRKGSWAALPAAGMPAPHSLATQEGKNPGLPSARLTQSRTSAEKEAGSSGGGDLTISSSKSSWLLNCTGYWP